MNCLILVPSYRDLRHYVYSFPLGLGYIAAVLKMTPGLNVFTLNLNHLEGDETEHVLAAIRRWGIEAVLVGGLYLDYRGIKAVLSAVKAHDRRIHTLVGGLIVTGDPEAAMTALDEADYGLMGEGEINTPALCLCLKNGDDPETVGGLIYRKEGRLHRTRPQAETPDLSSLPWCDYEAFGLDHYLDHSLISSGQSCMFASYPSRTVPIMSSRGCPYHCTFCAHPTGSYRERSLDDFFAELDYLVGRFRIEYVGVYDDLLGRTEERLSEFCRRIRDYRLLGWTSSFRIDQLTREKLAMIRDSGFKTLGLGLESASDPILKSMKKGLTVRELEEGLEMVRQAGLKIIGNFIFGDSEETVETSRETIDWWLRHPQHQINLAPIRCYPGSPLYWRAVAEGRIQDPVEFLKNGCPEVNVSKMTDDEYQELVREKIPSLMRTHGARYPDFEQWVVRKTHPGRHAVDVDCLCGHCGRVSRYRNIDMYRIAWLACHHCETRHVFPEPKKLVPDVISGSIDYLLENHGQVGLWGIGGLFKKVITPEMASRPGVHLLDGHSGGQYGSKTVEPPEAVSEHGLDLIVTMPEFSPNYREISQLARERYGVETVLTFSDLLSADPSAHLGLQPARQ